MNKDKIIKFARGVMASGLYLLGWIWVAGMCFTFGSAYWALKDMPELPDLSDERRPVSVTFYDRHDNLIGVRGALPSRPSNLDLLPDHLPEAIIAIEDRRFYAHVGLDPKGLLRAAIANHEAGRVVQGGSTLSQQLAKNLFLTGDRTFKRKAQEAFIALKLETQFSKREIMELYLGRVYFGAGAYGIDAAAERYFAKPSADLTLAESAMLAGLLKAPAAYAPEQDPRPAGARAKLVLDAMVRDERIWPQARDEILGQTLWVEPTARRGAEHYFLDFAWAEMLSHMGEPDQDLTVYTTLDLSLQKQAETAVTSHIDPKRRASQAGVVMLDGSGGIRVLVGGADYAASEYNRVSQARRQPGSSFKPFVYLTAIEAGLSPDDIRTDQVVKIGDWEPRNFKPDFRGEVTIETALALSLNTIAVQLSEEVGRPQVIATAARFGLSPLRDLRSLPLGAQEFTPLQMAESYLPFANQGYLNSSYAITGIERGDGRIIYRHNRARGARVIDPGPLRQINRMMMAVMTKGTGRSAQITGWDLAGKTGTTNDYRDAWFIGYAPDLVTAVWVGNDENLAMRRVTGASIPARIWKDVMEAGLADRRPTALPRAVPSVVIDISAPPGELSQTTQPLP